MARRSISGLGFLSAMGLLFILVVYGPAWAEESKPAAGPEPLKPDAVARTPFANRDKDGDGKLSEVEFVLAASEADRPLVKRDFHLLDFDRDKFLSLEEFRNVPYLVPRDERGQLPDPVSRLAETHFKNSLEAWETFDDDSDDKLSQNEYRTGSLELLRLKTPALRNWGAEWALLDRNGDGFATRDEWRWFLDVWYGVRRPQGELLRSPAGLVINWMYYKFSDRDSNDRIDPTEFVKFGFDGKLWEKRLAEIDRNGDGFVSFAEWSGHDSRLLDLFWQYRTLDTNLDARIDRGELAMNIPDWQQPLAKYVFPGFDTDRDGFLSLEEFALTPLYSQFTEWHAARGDRNADGTLTFAEFQFDQGPSLLGLTAEYFRRLDVNEDDLLDHDEWQFDTPEAPKSRLYAMNADGTDIELIADVGTFDATYLGSPDWSHDGKSLVFDATPATGAHSNFSLSMILRIEMAGPNKGKIEKLGYGNCPDWSPDDKRVTFFVNGGNPDNDQPGVWVMNADGTGREFIGAGLSSPRWSPDGNSLLCANSFSSPKSYFLVDVMTGQRKQVLKKVVGLGVPDWEPGGNLVCTTLRVQNRRTLCLIDLSGDPDSIVELWKADAGREQPMPTYDNSRPNWSADGLEIVFTDNSSGQSVLNRIATSGETDPVVIAPVLKHIDVNAVWSPDRKRIVFCSTQPPIEIPGLKLPVQK